MPYSFCAFFAHKPNCDVCHGHNSGTGPSHTHSPAKQSYFNCLSVGKAKNKKYIKRRGGKQKKLNKNQVESVQCF